MDPTDRPGAAAPDAPSRPPAGGAPVRVERIRPHVALVVLDRPERLNALDADVVGALHGALRAVGEDPTCRVVVLTGAGRAFCAGLDLHGYGDPGRPGAAPGDGGPGDEGPAAPVQLGLRVQVHIASLVERLRSLPQPVIAAVNGAASGGGLALVLASDIRLAGASARFNAAFVRIGLSACDIGTSWLLPRLVGAGRAHELMLTGRFVDAEEAARIGLVLEAVPDAELLDRALDEAELIARNSPAGVRMTKEVMWSALEIPGQRAAIDLENRSQVLLTLTRDHHEAIAAFLERRDPDFHDR